MLIHTVPTRPQRHHQQQSPDHRQSLEEIILQKIPHGLIIGDTPPGVEVEVEDSKPQHQYE